ncbi:hypothetical protein RB195_020887 [Necator americanus]|uniref:Uncharacterized protein n=1 Tax=Necator americanus TaxID=51031 RepID=A0ABR1CMM4_NECAM
MLYCIPPIRIRWRRELVSRKPCKNSTQKTIGMETTMEMVERRIRKTMGRLRLETTWGTYYLGISLRNQSSLTRDTSLIRDELEN